MLCFSHISSAWIKFWHIIAFYAMDIFTLYFTGLCFWVVDFMDFAS